MRIVCYQPPSLYGRILVFLCLVMLMSLESSICKAQTEKSWANPILINGSSFGNIFQQLYLTNDFQQMLRLTAAGSREQHGDSTILAYYKLMQFAYPIKLISHTRQGQQYSMVYKTNINATMHKIKVDICVENDTARIILPGKFDESKYFLLGY